MLVLSGIFLIAGLAAAQDSGSIPEELLRPRRGESARYPIDTVIGQLGRGEVSAGAFSFANSAARGLLSGNPENPSIASLNRSLREDYIAVLKSVQPVNYRLGGGREEPDGAVSFLVRFIGREQSITGELFIRLESSRIERFIDEEVEISTTESWRFEELILEEAKSREEQQSSERQRFDFSPYERFF